MKRFDLHGNHFMPTEVFNINQRKTHTFTRTKIMLRTKMRVVRAIPMCSTIILDCRCGNGIIKHYLERVLFDYNVFGYTLRAQKDYSISRQKRLSMSSMHVHVSSARDPL